MPQKDGSGLTSSKPTSHASWSRQTTCASAVRPLVGLIRRTRLRSGSPAPTTARHPDLLMSTVTPLAFCRWASSSHSTWNFTRETMRRWVRNFSHRSSRTLPAGMLIVSTAVSVAMPASQLVGFVTWPGRAKDKIFRGAGAVNSTSYKFLRLRIPNRPQENFSTALLDLLDRSYNRLNTKTLADREARSPSYRSLFLLLMCRA